MPRGFSVHVFKPSVSSTHPYNASAKPEPAQPAVGAWQKSSGYASRSNFERKPSLTPSAAYRITQPAVHHLPLDSKRSKTSKGYGIYPDASNDVYIYERSFSTASDALASSSSSSSSDSDFVPESTVSTTVEISSTRASSSTETLETTALTAQYALTGPPARPTLTRAPSSDRARITPDGSRIYPPGLLPNSEGNPYRTLITSNPNTALLPRSTTVETVSESDSDTFIDDEIDMPMSRRPTNPRQRTDSLREPRATITEPTASLSRRYSDERRDTSQQSQRIRSSTEDSRGTPLPPAPLSSSLSRQESLSGPRAPPGLSSTAARATDGRDLLVSSYGGSPPDARRPANMTRDPSTSRQDSTSRNEVKPPGSSPPSAAPPISRVPSSRQAAPAPPLTYGAPFSDGALTVATRRCVRWTEDLMCPCPVPRNERRKGWFNRRGDQLWTNDGKYKSPEPGTEYPPDLTGYPEPSCGWMNEEGVRIDMEHRLVPKPPLRSVLKRPKPAPSAQ
ncbi:hypothetical protein IEO21_03021 [Rhodonia placenta]|uniref:Uncharacterized protein n=1 Tax=Rhodonia placenta TaxID=104341 RepID=A0A8H7P6I4_9APHY|nr:hypothetical protein IEO21_03021 [Postia placenta]